MFLSGHSGAFPHPHRGWSSIPEQLGLASLWHTLSVPSLRIAITDNSGCDNVRLKPILTWVRSVPAVCATHPSLELLTHRDRDRVTQPSASTGVTGALGLLQPPSTFKNEYSKGPGAFPRSCAQESNNLYLILNSE